MLPSLLTGGIREIAAHVTIAGLTCNPQVMIAMDDLLDRPVLICGLPRSGTSLTAGILAICGLWLGRTVPGGGSENPKGFFENVFLRERINKQITHQ